MDTYQELLKPEIVREISGLSLMSRVIVDSYLQGLNKSRHLGVGMEFSQYRGYEAGDDLRLLDWKMLARSGRYYIKQSEIESQISVKFIMDASASMGHSEHKITKMDFLRIMVASISYLAYDQGDDVGLFALNQHELRAVYPRAVKKDFNRLLHELIAIDNRGKWPESSASFNQIHSHHRKEIVFFITDMHQHTCELQEFAKALKTDRNEVAVLQIIGEQEMEFEYKGTLTFEDMETGEKVKITAKEAKAQYLKDLKKSIKDNEDFFLGNGVDYQLFKMNEPLTETLKLYLKKRIKLV